MQLLLGTVHPGDVFESHVGALTVFKNLGFGLADVEDLAAARRTASKSPHEEHPDHDHQPEENDPREYLPTPFVGGLVTQVEALAFLQFLHFGLVCFALGNVHAGVSAGVERLEQLRIGFPPCQTVPDRLGEVEFGTRAVVADARDLTLLGHFFELGPLHLTLGGRVADHHHGEQEHGYNRIHPVEIHLAARLVARLLSLVGRACLLVVHGQSVVLCCSVGASPHSSSKA